MKTKLFKVLETTILNLDISKILEARKPILQQLIDYIQQKKDTGEPINLNFICTHNSRRSHFSQIWAQTLAAYLGVDNVFCYSGGTEVTALFPKVLETLQTNGFTTTTIANSKNSVYAIKYSKNAHPIIGFSKKFDDAFNPNSDFAAIMTCSQADEGCPFVPGCDKRIALTFEDPKLFDNTSQQSEKYQERSMQIATELLYVFSNIK